MQWLKYTILAAAVIGLPAMVSASEATPATLPTPASPDENAAFILRPSFDFRGGLVFVADGQANPVDPGVPHVFSLHAELAQREKGAYLGISATPPPPVLRRQLELADGMGLVVEFIMPDSPATVAGLKEFDVLQKLDDQLLINPQQLAVLVRSHKPGDEIKLAVIRQGKPMVLTAKLVEHELEPLGEIERAQDQMAEQMRRMLPEAGVHPILPGNGPMQFQMLVNGANGGGAASFTLLEGDRSYTINTDHAGHKTFIVKDKDGKSVFDGLIDTPEQRGKLPDDLKAKLERMELLTPKGDKGAVQKDAARSDKPEKKDGNK